MKKKNGWKIAEDAHETKTKAACLLDYRNLRMVSTLQPRCKTGELGTSFRFELIVYKLVDSNAET
jgi:hypothetical protein